MTRILYLLLGVAAAIALSVVVWSAFAPGADPSGDERPPPVRPEVGTGTAPHSGESDVGPARDPSRRPPAAPTRHEETRPATLAEARAFLQADDPAKALGVLDRILREDPKNADALHARGEANRAIGFYRKAESDFRGAVEHGGESAERIEAHAEMLHRLRRFKEAEERVRKAIALDSRRALSHALLAKIHLQQGRDELARAEARLALALDPRHPLAQSVLDQLR